MNDLREQVKALIHDMRDPDAWASLTEDSFPHVVDRLRSALLAGDEK